MEPM